MEKKRPSQANLMVRECIVTALMRLLEEKTFSAITITELTERAGVSRMSYYRNYHNKEDIFSSFIEDILREYKEEFNDINDNSCFYDYNNLYHCFSYFEKHKEFIHCLCQSGFGHMLLMSLNDYLLKMWYQPDDDKKQYLRIQAFAGALYNVFLIRTFHEEQETPEELAEILSDIFRRTGEIYN